MMHGAYRVKLCVYIYICVCVCVCVCVRVCVYIPPSGCVSVYSHGKNSDPTRQTFMKFHICLFFENM